MYLTRFSDIGLRVLMYLAKEQPDRPIVTINEITGQYGLPRNHVIKITSQLVKGGWLHSVRGRSGGLALAKPSHLIRVGQVIRYLENRHEMIDCAGIACKLSPSCELRTILGMAMGHFYTFLDRYTLSDLVRGSTGDEIVILQKRFLSDLNMRQTG